MDGRFKIVILLTMSFTLGTLGCVGGAAQLLYVLKGQKVAAEFKGLQGKKVAVVCVSDASAYGPNTLTYSVEHRVADLLRQNVKKIEMIPRQTVDQWKDQYGWDETNYYEIGRGVGADLVVAIEIASYTLHDGQTMYKGHTTVGTTVFDIQSGDVVFHRGPEEFVFPKSGRPAMQNNDRQFEQAYLHKLCSFLARRFYPYEHKDIIAEDAGG